MRDVVDATGLSGGYRQGLLNALSGVETAVDFLPVVGDALGLEDASRAYRQGDMVGTGINLMGVVPIIGDAGVKLSKGARSALRDQGFTEGFFHASKQDIQDGFKAGYNDGMVFVTPEREFANNWVGKGKYQQRLGEESIDDMRRADRQKLWDEYESQYGSYENWPAEIEDEYNARSMNLARQYQASGGAIYPVAVKANKQFDPEENPEIIAEFLKSQGRDPNATTIVSGKTDLEAYQEGNYLFYENKEMADFLRDKGYDSVWLREDTTSQGLSKPFSTLAVLDETGVKPVYDFAREADAAKPSRNKLSESEPVSTWSQSPRTPSSNEKIIDIPISMIEHGEAAMPGGTLSFPNAQETIQEYAQRNTEIPAIDVLMPDEDSPFFIVEDGSRRLEAAKLRGDKTIKAIVPKDYMAK